MQNSYSQLTLAFSRLNAKGIEQHADSYIKWESFSVVGKITLTLFCVILEIMLWLTLKLNPRPQLSWNLMKQKCSSKEFIKISSKWQARFEEWQPGYYFSSHQRFLNMLQKCCTWLRGREVMKHMAVLVPLCWMITGAVAFGKGGRVIINKNVSKIYHAGKNHCPWESSKELFPQ